ncbi:MAG: N,N-dimethylformamidase beta subunit family domain-containing protein [Acidimicrobiales bacterium]
MSSANPTENPTISQTADPSGAADSQPGKIITGYCEPWSLRAGESISLMASSHLPCDAELSLVRLHCGDPTRSGPGFNEEAVLHPDLAGGGQPTTVALHEQPLRPGSYGNVDLDGLSVTEAIGLRFSLMVTRPAEPQTIATLIGDSLILQVNLENGLLRAKAGATDLALRPSALEANRWYEVELTCDLAAGTIVANATTRPSASPGRDLVQPNGDQIRQPLSIGPSKLGRLILGGDDAGGGFDGRIAKPQLTIDSTELEWDLAQEIDGPTMVETSGNHRHGELRQLPTRAVTGPDWDGSHQRWTDEPRHWDAVHFHKDDMYDAGWAETTQITLPNNLPSGIYAFKLRADPDSTEVQSADEAERNAGLYEDRIPFFVRPAVGAATADVALLMSSATYLAYANHRMLFEGADFIVGRNRLRPEHEYIRQHPELGRSMYEKHPDHSGVMFSSRRRPVLNLRPGADGWNFTPDTDINAFMEHELGRMGKTHDVIADEDVHWDGLAALEPYRVIVTCSHPEYWSTAMLDALEQWQRGGGRLMYLGGNGFYWRVSFSEKWPGAMELRRAEDGVRNWQTGNGENYHAWGGEYGGMWRRNGRPPNELVGVGFAAQGFARASHYDVNPDSLEGSSGDTGGPDSSRAAWVWDGVEIEDGRIGTSGLGGGAAGQELDRYDTRLGSPGHAVVLASATEFGPDMVRTKEEFEGSVSYPTPDPYVRADIVFYETPNGGAVFSVGSISWFGALARNGYDNDVAKMTANVLHRFADPTPFEPPRRP